jgi:MazG family protein
MSAEVERLVEIITRLRAPGGCPWDREQTASSLRPSLLEESYEVIDAIDRNHAGDLEDELGDLLINILMQAQIASEQNSFTLESIAANAREKLVRRHPHVFAAAPLGTSAEVLTQWEEIKRVERTTKNEKELEGEPLALSLLDGVTIGLPALVRAHKIQKRAAKAGFDWERPGDVIDKVREELLEVESELEEPDERRPKDRLTEEIGDLLFAVVNLARALSIDSESALREATGKFAKRFQAMEQDIPAGRPFVELSLAEMNSLWEKAKSRERAS